MEKETRSSRPLATAGVARKPETFLSVLNARMTQQRVAPPSRFAVFSCVARGIQDGEELLPEAEVAFASGKEKVSAGDVQTRSSWIWFHTYSDAYFIQCMHSRRSEIDCSSGRMAALFSRKALRIWCCFPFVVFECRPDRLER